MSLSPSQEQFEAADKTTTGLNTVNDTQHSRMPSPTPQSAQSPTIATQTPTQPTETSPHSSHQQQSSSQPAPNTKAPPESSLRNPSPTRPPPSSMASMTNSLLSPSNNMTETQRQPNGHAINGNNSRHQSPEPQHQQPDPLDFSEPLEDHNWDDLEARFQAKMAECDRAEEGIEGEFKELLNVCFIHLCLKEQKMHVMKYISPRSHNHNANQHHNRSSSASGHKPVPRTRKTGRLNGAYPFAATPQATHHPMQSNRSPPDVYSLRTRMAFVQQSEKTLGEKQKHYTKVVQAFESALALLAD